MEHYYQNIGEDWFGYNTLYSTMVKNYKAVWVISK